MIRTEGAAVSTGAITWQVDNDPATYFSVAKGRVTLRMDVLSAGSGWPWFSTSTVYALAWSGGDALIKNSANAIVGRCNQPLAGTLTAVVRWSSTTAVEPTGSYMECLTDGIQDTWVTKPTSGWTPAPSTVLSLNSFIGGANDPIAAIQTIRIEDGP